MAFYFSYDADQLDAVLNALPMHERLSLYEKEKLHCTILYTNEIYSPKVKEILFPSIEVVIDSITTWNTVNGKVLVAILDSEKLYEYHNIIKENISSGNKQFIPHITLQKKEHHEILMDVEALEFLKGKKITLHHFQCLLPEKELEKIAILKPLTTLKK